jgi:hypothetical protein
VKGADLGEITDRPRTGAVALIALR